MSNKEQSILDELSRIQKKLKAPKGQTNKFGGYKYRSCEDILEALKPILGESSVTITDEIVLVGDRYYVKATAALNACDDIFAVSAYAREPETKKGMDLSQITGAASSYARKYALNGLFCIDDTKDADATNDHAPAAPDRFTPDLLLKLLEQDGKPPTEKTCEWADQLGAAQLKKQILLLEKKLHG